MDFIGVVAVSRPWQPARPDQAVIATHGGRALRNEVAWGLRRAFLPARSSAASKVVVVRRRTDVEVTGRVTSLWCWRIVTPGAYTGPPPLSYFTHARAHVA